MEEYQLQILANVIGDSWSDISREKMQIILNAIALVGSEPDITREGGRFLEALANLLRTLNDQFD